MPNKKIPSETGNAALDLALDTLNLGKRDYELVTTGNIERIIEDDLELNERTKREISESRKGKSISHSEVKKRLRL